MSTTLFLVRHGETVWHAENRYAGVSDVALTERGRRQAARLARWACRTGLDAVWASPLSRARATAAPSARALGLPVEVDADLAELDFGSAEGRTLAELPPEQAAAFRADPVAGAFPGAEDPVAAAARGAAALHRIAARHPGGRILVVAHNTLLRLVLCELLGLPLARYRTAFPVLRNCCPTELVMDRGGAGLVALNTPLP
ncbi:histidine phosphatase family protein [Thermomonospora catenispora]|uniref:histidine phosphatase family protein n=1 Tax=Thermomonospora catenispora TaxID=2493090 RepID=UPI00111F92EE|nr:histidine phosphatase family protein [Thermomonospora catenispora]TNY37049.1 histidine phosphatase family protein [Thermomonospora catenispora]